MRIEIMNRCWKLNYPHLISINKAIIVNIPNGKSFGKSFIVIKSPVAIFEKKVICRDTWVFIQLTQLLWIEFH